MENFVVLFLAVLKARLFKNGVSHNHESPFWNEKTLHAYNFCNLQAVWCSFIGNTDLLAFCTISLCRAVKIVPKFGEICSSFWKIMVRKNEMVTDLAYKTGVNFWGHFWGKNPRLIAESLRYSSELTEAVLSRTHNQMFASKIG